MVVSDNDCCGRNNEENGNYNLVARNRKKKGVVLDRVVRMLYYTTHCSRHEWKCERRLIIVSKIKPKIIIIIMCQERNMTNPKYKRRRSKIGCAKQVEFFGYRVFAYRTLCTRVSHPDHSRSGGSFSSYSSPIFYRHVCRMIGKY